MGCGASAVSPVAPAPVGSPAGNGTQSKPSQADQSSPGTVKHKPSPLNIVAINGQVPSSPSDVPQPMMNPKSPKHVTLDNIEPEADGDGYGVIRAPASQRSVRFGKDDDEDPVEEVKSFNPSPRTSHRVVSEEEAEEEDAIVAYEEQEAAKLNPLLGSWKGKDLEVTFTTTGCGAIVGDLHGSVMNGRIAADSFRTTVFAGKTIEPGILFWLLLDGLTGGLRGWYSAVGSESTGESWTGYKMRSGAVQNPGFEGVWIMSAADGEESRLALRVPPAGPEKVGGGDRLNGDISISSLDEAARVSGVEYGDASAASGTYVFKEDPTDVHSITRSFVIMQDFHGAGEGMQIRFWVDGGPGVTMWKSHVLHKVLPKT